MWQWIHLFRSYCLGSTQKCNYCVSPPEKHKAPVCEIDRARMVLVHSLGIKRLPCLHEIGSFTLFGKTTKVRMQIACARTGDPRVFEFRLGKLLGMRVHSSASCLSLCGCCGSRRSLVVAWHAVHDAGYNISPTVNQGRELLLCCT